MAPFDPKGAVVDLLLPSFRTASLVRNIRNGFVFADGVRAFVFANGVMSSWLTGSDLLEPRSARTKCAAALQRLKDFAAPRPFKRVIVPGFCALAPSLHPGVHLPARHGTPNFPAAVPIPQFVTPSGARPACRQVGTCSCILVQWEAAALQRKCPDYLPLVPAVRFAGSREQCPLFSVKGTLEDSSV
jgi:hypothetical protein